MDWVWDRIVLAQYHYVQLRDEILRTGLLLSFTQVGACSAPGVPMQNVVADEEALPFDTDSFDLATSSLRWDQ